MAVSLMQHYGQTYLLSHANFLNVVSVLTMSSYMKWKIIKIISRNYTFLPANSKLKQIWIFLNECFQTEFLDGYCVIPEPRVNSLLFATRPYSGMLDACACHYFINETARKQFSKYMGRWKFHFRSSQHLSNKDIKQTINLWKMVIGEPKRN